jgi:peptidoglycan/LPS O-acetylase OafA/YrhL
MALSIMLYHFGGQHDAATPLGRLGIYGVSIFFILSGLSMAIAYDRYIQDFKTSVTFFIRRLFRILPLLWLAIALVVIPTWLLGKGTHGQDPYSFTTIALNLTTLFGFVAPAEYINMGAWSIGNEMVYYAFTPMFIGAYHWRKSIGNAMTLVTVGIGLLFAFSLLNSADKLEVQWATYIIPFNNLYLYCAGLAIYYNFRDLTVPAKWHLPLLLFSVLAFFFYPASGDQINLVTGFNRVSMSIISVSIVFAFYKCAPFLPKFIGNKFEQLGIATYGVYLLHPIVLDFTRGAFQIFGLEIKFLPTIVAMGLTLAFARLTYKFLEAPLTNLGKRLTNKGSKNVTKSGVAVASGTD